MSTAAMKKPANEGRANPKHSSGQAQANDSTARVFPEAMTAKVFPVYSDHRQTRPTGHTSIERLAVDMSLGLVPVGPKNQAQALTPFKAEGKTNAHAQEADYYALVVDHDNDDKTAEQIRAVYDAWGMAYLAFTSASHELPKDGVVGKRWKVLIPLAGACPHARYMKVAAGVWPLMGSDEVQSRKAQVFYAPNRVTQDAPFDYIDATDRPLLDANTDDHPFVVVCLEAQAEQAERQAQARAARPLPRPVSGTDGGIIDKVRQQHDLRGELWRVGYRQIGEDLFLSPYSSTGSAGVRILTGDDGVERVYSHHGKADPLSHHNHEGHALDVFDVIRIFHYDGDISRAVADLADKVDPEGQRERRQAHAEAESKAEAQAHLEEVAEHDEDGQKKPFSLASFSLAGKSHDMKVQMLDDSFVLDGLAIAGQITCFYAPPNAGKTLLTLRLLMDSIERGDVDGDKLFYINADDNYKGLVTKLELAEKHGFHMLAPGHGGFKSEMFAEYLEQMTKDGSAAGTIIVLDTLKKFSDLMDKQASSRFMNHVREFNSHGGTVILMAHTNKNRSDDGKLVHAGTSDVVDDIDCAYMIDAMEKGPFDVTRTVKLENFKARGDVLPEVSYKYSTEMGQHYHDLVDSVEKVSNEEAQQAQAKDMAAQAVERNREIIDVLFEAMGTDKVGKPDLVKAATDAGFSRRAANKVIKQHAGENWQIGHRWAETTGDNNAKFYQRIEPWQGVAIIHDDWDDDIVF